MKKVSFAKMSGAGNDFILFDRKFNPALKLNPENIRKICKRRTGIGSDGIIVISDHPVYDFDMEYYNADGSSGTLCGNGARCAIRYSHLAGRFHSGKTRFISNGIEYSGEVLDTEHVRFNLNKPFDMKQDLTINAAGQTINCSFINTGSPHVVIFINELLVDPSQKDLFFSDMEKVPVFNLGQEIRYLKEFNPGGTNVNFIKVEDNKILIRTYERGVENETLACGTGSVASAVISFLKGKVKPPVTLLTRSGDELTVDFYYDGTDVNNLSLTGPAEITFTGEFYSNLYFNNMEI